MPRSRSNNGLKKTGVRAHTEKGALHSETSRVCWARAVTGRVFELKAGQSYTAASEAIRSDYNS